MRITINPPPKDRNCECCGRNNTEIKPFGKAGDPLVGDFDGALLVKNFRGQDMGDQGGSIWASWECRECFLLKEQEYYDTINNRNKE